MMLHFINNYCNIVDKNGCISYAAVAACKAESTPRSYEKARERTAYNDFGTKNKNVTITCTNCIKWKIKAQSDHIKKMYCGLEADQKTLDRLYKDFDNSFKERFY